MTNTGTSRSRYRFSIALLLFIALCAAGILGGYRAGFDQGYGAGGAKRESEKPYVKVYPVGEAVRYAADEENPAKVNGRLNLDSLIQVIQTTITPEQWDVLGGPCTIQEDQTTETLVIVGNTDMHEKIGTLLTDLDAAKAALDQARIEEKEREIRIAKNLEKLFEPISQRLGKKLTPIPSRFQISGSWQLNSATSETPPAPFSYKFLDEREVLVTTIAESDQDPVKGGYSAYSGNLSVNGWNYNAATTDDGELVLADSNDTTHIWIATKTQAE